MQTKTPVETVPHLLDEAERSILASGRFEPVTVDTLMERASQFATRVRYAIERPTAMQQLHTATGAITSTTTIDDLLTVFVDRAIELMGADFGDVRLRDPKTGELLLVAHAGFDEEFIDRFGLDCEQGTPHGLAASAGQQVVMDDIARDPAFPRIRPAAAHAGFRSTQCTPIRDYAGRTIGVVSTHWRRPQRPSLEDLCLIDLFAGFAGDQMTRLLGLIPDVADETVPEGAIEAVTRAIIVPLLTPLEELDVEARQARTSTDPDAVPPASLVEQLPAFADQIVSGLLAAALTLDSAKSMVPGGPAAERLAAAHEVIDRMLRQVRSFMVDGQLAGRAGAAPRLTRPTRKAPAEAG